MGDRLGYRRGREEGMNTVAMATGLLLPPLFDGSSGARRGGLGAGQRLWMISMLWRTAWTSLRLMDWGGA